MAIKFGEGYEFSNGLDRESTVDDVGTVSASELQSAILERHVEEPIMTCVGTLSDFDDTLPEDFRGILEREKTDHDAHIDGPNIDNVSFKADTKDKEQAGLISSGPYQYVMSPVDSKDKFSSGFYSCLGLVVVGKIKRRGRIFL